LETKKIKVCYVISVLKNSTGKGGHFHSLKALVDEIEKEVSVSVIVIGAKIPDVIALSNLEVFNIKTNWDVFTFFDIFKIKEKINKICPDIIHAYDNTSLIIINALNLLGKKPVIFTKCGGENPSKKLLPQPYSKTIICFSEENLAYYKNDYKFKDSILFHIPNRSKNIFSDNICAEKIRSVVGSGLVILRIGRFSPFHKKTFEQTIALFKELSSNKNLNKIKLVLIGAIESEDVLNELKESCKGWDIFFFTEDEYTTEASRLICVGDFVVGTGRSLMEAASKGKVLLTPIKNGRFPIIVDEVSFEECFKTNFSARNIVLSYNEKENIDKINKAVQDNKYKKSLEEFSKRIFDEYFDIKKSAELHLKIYFSAKKDVSFIKSICYTIVGLVRLIRIVQ